MKNDREFWAILNTLASKGSISIDYFLDKSDDKDLTLTAIKRLSDEGLVVDNSAKLSITDDGKRYLDKAN